MFCVHACVTIVDVSRVRRLLGGWLADGVVLCACDPRSTRYQHAPSMVGASRVSEYEMRRPQQWRHTSSWAPSQNVASFTMRKEGLVSLSLRDREFCRVSRAREGPLAHALWARPTATSGRRRGRGAGRARHYRRHPRLLRSPRTRPSRHPPTCARAGGSSEA